MKKQSSAKKKVSRKRATQNGVYPRKGFKNILVPIDFSTHAQELYHYALSFIEVMEANMTLLYVCPQTALALVDKEKLEGYGNDYLEQQRRSAGDLQDQINIRVVSGVPSHEITQHAEKNNQDLIMITTHGNTGLKHVLLGSTAERIVRHASTPVLVHRPKKSKSKAKICRFSKILVPVDFSEKSKKTLTYAQNFAKDFGATLDIVHVVEPPAYPEFGYAHLAVKERTAIKAAKGQMDHFLESAKVDMDLVNSHSIKTGSAHYQITEWAKKKRSDLIILSTQGNTGLKHVLLGSTAERVVQHASCSVLVVR